MGGIRLVNWWSFLGGLIVGAFLFPSLTVLLLALVMRITGLRFCPWHHEVKEESRLINPAETRPPPGTMR